MHRMFEEQDEQVNTVASSLYHIYNFPVTAI